MRTSVFCLILVAAAACANKARTVNDDTPTCTTMAECSAHDGERVEVVAVYTVWDPRPQQAQSASPARQVMLVFENGEEGPFLEAWGREGHMRSPGEIERFEGKKVRVTGRFSSEMPPHPTDPPHAASLAGPCIHPVESIALAE